MGLFGKRKKKQDVGSDDPPFTFSWKKPRNTALHLAMFLLFSTLVHTTSFYLFQVVYPDPVRAEPVTERITILDSRNPVVRSAMERVKDRSIYLQAPSSDANVRLRLQDFSARFTPTFQEAKPVFLPPVESPGISSSSTSRFADGEKFENLFLLSGNLKSRGLAPWSVLNDYLAAAGEVPGVRLNIAVSADGQIETAQTEGGGLTEEEKSGFARVIQSTLRFQPVEKAESDKGWIEILPRSP